MTVNGSASSAKSGPGRGNREPTLHLHLHLHLHLPGTGYQRVRVEGRNGLVVVIVQLARLLLPHLVQLTLIFLSVTALTLVLADVANAVH